MDAAKVDAEAPQVPQQGHYTNGDHGAANGLAHEQHGQDGSQACSHTGDDSEDNTSNNNKQPQEDRQMAQLWSLVRYAVVFFVFGMQVSILGPTLVQLADHLDVEVADVSPLFTALGVGCIVSGTPAGWVIDRLPIHHVLLMSLVITAAGFAIVPLVPTVAVLTVLYFFIALNFSFTNTSVFTALSWTSPKRMGPSINLVLAMFGIGSFANPLAARACHALTGSSLSLFWVVAIASVLVAVPFAFVPSPVRPAGDGGDGGSKHHHGSRALELAVTIVALHIILLATSAEASNGNWIFSYAKEQISLSDNDAAFVNSAFWAAFTCGRILAAMLSRATQPAVLLLGGLPFALSGVLVPIIIGPSSMTMALTMTQAVLTGLGNSVGYANGVALMERYVPMTGFLNGVIGAVAGGGFMVGPVLVAQLAKHTSLGLMSMPWVALGLYSLQVPVIGATVLLGRRLLLTPLLEPLLEDSTPHADVQPLGHHTDA